MKDLHAFYQDENSSANLKVDRRFYRNFHYSPHYHTNPEIVYVAKGQMDVIIDGMNMSIPAQHFCLILPWQIHSFSTPEYSHAVIIVFPEEYISSFIRNMASSHGEPQVFTAEAPIHNLFITYLFNGFCSNSYILSCIFYGLCHSFINHCKVVQNSNRNKTEVLVKIMDYISTHFNEKLSLQDVSRVFNYNYCYLSHLFHEYAGTTFQQFKMLKRIEYARNELVFTQKQVTDIAFECGFTCIRSFNRAFQNYVMMSPSEYRSKYSMTVGEKRFFFQNEYVGIGEAPDKTVIDQVPNHEMSHE